MGRDESATTHVTATAAGMTGITTAASMTTTATAPLRKCGGRKYERHHDHS
jgi:hypothetical protein